MEEQTLSKNQSSLIKKFITTFLPFSNNKRKYSHNQFSYVHTTISKIISQNLQINITPLQLVQLFSELNYIFYVSEKNTNQKPPVPFLDFPTHAFVHLNISSKKVLMLKKATNSILYIKNPTQIENINALKEQIKIFFNQNFKS